MAKGSNLAIQRNLGIIPNLVSVGTIRRLIQRLEGDMEGVRKESENRSPACCPCGDRSGVGGTDQTGSIRGRQRTSHHHHVQPHSFRERLLDDLAGEGKRLPLVRFGTRVRPRGERNAQADEVEADVSGLGHALLVLRALC